MSGADSASYDPPPEDPEDYMSETFLASLVSAPEKKSQPKPASKKRRRPAPAPPRLSRAAEMARARAEGLQRKVGHENLGFKMLAKMGYTEGKGIGKDERGRMDPVAVEIKVTRSGIGTELAASERCEDALRRAAATVKQQRAVQTNFRSQRSALFASKRDERNAERAAGVVESLDAAAGVPRHSLWPQEPVAPLTIEEAYEAAAADGDEIEDNEGASELPRDPPTEALRRRLAYLRERHFYCMWCGVRHDGMADLAASCPGVTEEEH